MTISRYPAILDISLNVLIRAEPGERVTPELVTRALGATSTLPATPESFETVHADLEQANLLDDDGCLTPLADRYGDMWRRFLARETRGR